MYNIKITSSSSANGRNCTSQTPGEMEMIQQSNASATEQDTLVGIQLLGRNTVSMKVPVIFSMKLGLVVKFG